MIMPAPGINLFKATLLANLAFSLQQSNLLAQTQKM